ncbi:MAG: cob(I)yrinic acid a,c-diamide adenosyltransferase [Candidatus Contubernalis sp.]|nr:cob(I)yrinic acid a,c-diamide adenosyltransferase [Candidatus Contubernalis sp.]
MLKVSHGLELIKLKPPRVELVFTGRGIPLELMEAADLVSEINAVKRVLVIIKTCVFFQKGCQKS